MLVHFHIHYACCFFQIFFGLGFVVLLLGSYLLAVSRCTEKKSYSLVGRGTYIFFHSNSLFVAYFTGKSSVTTAGGALGIVTAAIAFYTGAAGLLSPDTSYFSLPVLDMSRKD